MAEFLDLDTGPIESEDSFTLTVVRNAGRIIFGNKTRGYGKGLLVLPGGKDHYYLGSVGVSIMPGRDNASREVFEEIGIDVSPRDLSQIGVLHIATEDDNKDVGIFETYVRDIAPYDSDELVNVAWYDETSLPYDEMPVDYKLWLPSVLSGYAVTAYLDTVNDDLVDGTIYRQALNPLGRLEQLPIKVA